MHIVQSSSHMRIYLSTRFRIINYILFDNKLLQHAVNSTQACSKHYQSNLLFCLGTHVQHQANCIIYIEEWNQNKIDQGKFFTIFSFKVFCRSRVNLEIILIDFKFSMISFFKLNSPFVLYFLFTCTWFHFLSTIFLSVLIKSDTFEVLSCTSRIVRTLLKL